LGGVAQGGMQIKYSGSHSMKPRRTIARIRILKWLGLTYLVFFCGLFAYMVIFSVGGSQGEFLNLAFNIEDVGLMFAQYIIIFPLGLYNGLVPSQNGGSPLILIGYIVYPSHAIITLFLKSKRAIVVSLMVLIILLFLNLAGCHEILNQIGDN